MHVFAQTSSRVVVSHSFTMLQFQVCFSQIVILVLSPGILVPWSKCIIRVTMCIGKLSGTWRAIIQPKIPCENFHFLVPWVMFHIRGYDNKTNHFGVRPRLLTCERHAFSFSPLHRVQNRTHFVRVAEDWSANCRHLLVWNGSATIYCIGFVGARYAIHSCGLNHTLGLQESKKSKTNECKMTIIK